MPRGDGTGPNGAGPMTGRKAGYCAGSTVAGYMNPVPRRGFGFGRGRGWFGRGGGRGLRHRYWATGTPGWARAEYGYPAFTTYPYEPELTPKQETEMLKQEADTLKLELEEVQKRIETLEKVEKASQKDG